MGSSENDICVVEGCKNTTARYMDIQFKKVPRNPFKTRNGSKANKNKSLFLSLRNLYLKYRMCTDHFEEEMIYDIFKIVQGVTALPSLLGHNRLNHEYQENVSTNGMEQISPAEKQNNKKAPSHSPSIIPSGSAENLLQISDSHLDESQKHNLLELMKDEDKLKLLQNATMLICGEIQCRRCIVSNGAKIKLCKDFHCRNFIENFNKLKNPSFENKVSIMVDDNEELITKFIIKDVGDIHKFHKKIALPNPFWSSYYSKNMKGTIFYKTDDNRKPVMTLYFKGSLIPFVYFNGKEYNFNESISTVNQLENLMNKLNNVKVCHGYGGVISRKCVGNFDGSLEKKNMCVGCQDSSDNYLSKLKMNQN